MKGDRRAWAWVLAAAAVALLGTAVLAIGAMEGRVHLVFGGAMLWLIAAGVVLQDRALRPGREDGMPSASEKAAWGQIGMALAAILVLGGMALGSMAGSFASYLMFTAYALIVAGYPMFRRRFIEENRRYREVPEDERDRAIRAQGDYLSKRLLELALVALAVVWVLAPRMIQALGEPLQVAALLLLPVLVANLVGEARVALLYWRDRQ
ncbi:MAG TPA: hypothetical protein PK743_08140 [Luteimonas sp.]|nr:hypothetical protein [Luteimonas sp.]HRO25971.1 hypothetical protein [Luteimonas sp.]HRP72584.1 hypothetical protein [Luteimonas sp.]